MGNKVNGKMIFKECRNKKEITSKITYKKDFDGLIGVNMGRVYNRENACLAWRDNVY